MSHKSILLVRKARLSMLKPGNVVLVSGKDDRGVEHKNALLTVKEVGPDQFTTINNQTFTVNTISFIRRRADLERDPNSLTGVLENFASEPE